MALLTITDQVPGGLQLLRIETEGAFVGLVSGAAPSETQTEADDEEDINLA